MKQWKKTKKALAVLLCCVMAVSATGCGSFMKGFKDGLKESAKDTLASAASGSKNASEPVSEPEPEEASSEQETEKYNAYIDLNNYMVNDMYDALEEYFTNVQDKGDFALNSGEEYDVDHITPTDLQLLEKAYEMADKLPSYPEADAAVKKLYQPMKDIMESFMEAYDYIAFKSYKDDNYQKAKELHAIIYPAVSRYNAASDEFIAALNVIAEEVMAQDLQRYQEENMLISYNAIRILNTSEDIQSAILVQENISSANISQMDLTNIKPLYQDLLSQIEAFNTACGDVNIRKVEGLKGTNTRLTFLKEAIMDLKVSLTEMIDRVEKGKNFESYQLGHFAYTNEGTIECFYERLSKTIDCYNNLHR